MLSTLPLDEIESESQNLGRQNVRLRQIKWDNIPQTGGQASKHDAPGIDLTAEHQRTNKCRSSHGHEIPRTLRLFVLRPTNQLFLEKLIGVQLVNKSPPTPRFLRIRISAEQPGNTAHFEPIDSSPHYTKIFLKTCFKNIPNLIRLRFPSGLFLSGPPAKDL